MVASIQTKTHTQSCDILDSIVYRRLLHSSSKIEKLSHETKRSLSKEQKKIYLNV